jgi:hypothetical protein
MLIAGGAITVTYACTQDMRHWLKCWFTFIIINVGFYIKNRSIVWNLIFFTIIVNLFLFNATYNNHYKINKKSIIINGA